MTDALKIVGNWNNRIEVTLASALASSIEITGRSGKEACDHAVILMAKSARNMTPKSKARRQILTDEQGRKYIETWQQGKAEAVRLYKFQFDDPAKYNLKKSWTEAVKIGNRALAQRSWMWGLKKRTGHRPIPGVVTRAEIRGEKLCGVIVRNALSYLLKIMPGGWESVAQSSATNVIMAQAAKRLEREFGIEVPRAASRPRPATTLTAAWSTAT